MEASDWVAAVAVTAVGWIPVLAAGWWCSRHLTPMGRGGTALLWLYVAVSGLAGTWGVVSAFDVAFTYHTHTPNLPELMLGYVLGAAAWPFLALWGLLFLLGNLSPTG